MKVRVALLVFVVAMFMLPATASAWEMGFGGDYSDAEYYDPALDEYFYWQSPKMSFEATSDERTTQWLAQYEIDGGAWITVPQDQETRFTVIGAVDSRHTGTYRWIDAGGTVQFQPDEVETFLLDNVAPRTVAVNSIRVRRYTKATFKMQVRDQGATEDDGRIVIKKLDGRVVKSFETGFSDDQLSGKTISERIKINVPPGKYRWFITAADGCNKQKVIGRNYMTVLK